MGGGTALNLARELHEAGVLEELGIELIGANIDAIQRAEDRELFKQTVESCGLKVPTSRIVTSVDDLVGVSLPAVVRPAFTLGGHGGGFAETHEQLQRQVARGLSESPISQVLVEESVRGWDEFELEVVRDHADNVVIVCSIENLDPMGVHTGDSVTVAPQMTLPDEAYQELRNAAIAVVRAVGVDTGGSNIQFARDRDGGEIRVIEMNPRVSRSSALASKATGYPIAKVAAKLAVGYTLDEIPNDLTGTTPASFEPTLDYVVVKIPRFAFEKFPGADHDARHADEVGRRDDGHRPHVHRGVRQGEAGARRRLRLAPRRPAPLVPARAGGARRRGGAAGGRAARLSPHRLVRGRGRGCVELLLRDLGRAGRGAARPATAKRVVILGSGPNRIGQGVEFDYCCVHAVQTYRALGYEAIMVNCNPETVSTDYDTSDRLYFEPLDTASVLAICEREQPDGVVIQFGGQTPLKLARAIEAAGFRILGTPFDAVDLAEDRERFGELLAELGIRCPEWGIAGSGAQAVDIADRIGYPVLVRPSYVLGGRAMRVCHDSDQVREAFAGVQGPTLVDRFLENAIEIDVDALCDGTDTYVAAVMQHVEEAGVHSGDSACVLPAQSLTSSATSDIHSIVRRLGPALGVVGVLNVQLAVADDEVFVLEVNPRASRTVPFASKATGVNLVAAACRIAAGERVADLGLPAERPPRQVSVKAAVLPFARFPGADPVLGPEMRSTGEVMTSANDLPTALAKAERAAGRPLPREGAVFLSVRDSDKATAIPVAAAFAGLGFHLYATGGTARTLRGAGLDVDEVRKVNDPGDGPSVVDLIRRGRCNLIVNTPDGGPEPRVDGYLIREAALTARVPCVTTIAAATAAVHAIANARVETALSLQERIDVESRARAS